jgi:type IV pilus assembly protein PilA
MLRKLRERINEEKGFTLIELLVVILIIGILAAIALPAFLGQQQKGEDADAKSNARNAVSQVESCYANEQDYANCTTAAQLGNTGLDLGTGPTQVSITADGTTTPKRGFTIVGHAKSGNDFTIKKDESTGKISRSCTTPGKGGCPSGGATNW